MKKAAFFLIMMFCVFNVRAQREDNTWIFGYHYYPSFIPSMDFYYGTPLISGSNSPLDFFGCDASICSSTGDMLLYTDGVAVMNYLHDTIPGSQHFNDDSALVALYGYMPGLPKQAAFILPYPGNPNEYAIIHHSEHIWNNNQNFQPVKLSISVVDMSMNGGAGQMILKNQTIINDTLLFGTLQAVRHANGRDWWIMAHQWKSGNFYLMLLSPSGISNVQLIQTGPQFTVGFEGYAQSLFSPDGSYFSIARGDSTKVELFDFDRCAGTISFKEQIDLSGYNTTGYLSGCSFSPNHKQLYVSDGYSLYQYQMDSASISNSMKLIANWDGSGSFNAYYFMMHQLGPDGKIYIAPPSSNVLHVINNPDLPDTACSFAQHSITLLSWHGGALPVFPNYHLGRIIGSPCDTINFTGMDEAISIVDTKLFPNPNNGKFSFQYTLTNELEGNIEINDAEGRVVYKSILSKYSSVERIGLSIQKGVYFLKFYNGKEIKVHRFVVMD